MMRFLIAVTILSGLLGTTSDLCRAQSTGKRAGPQLRQAKDAPTTHSHPATVNASPASELPTAGPALDAAQAETQGSPADPKAKSPKRSAREKPPHGWGYLDFGGDILIPRKSQEYLTSAGGGGFSMDFRPIRYMQFGMLGTFLGNFNGTQTTTAPFTCTSGCTGTYSATLGARGNLFGIDGRAVLPLFRERLQISGGGGIGWVEAIESADTGGVNVPATCPPLCNGSTRGHGPLELAEIKYFPGSGHVGLGFHVRAIQVNSSGLNFSYAGGNYRDNFLQIGGQIAFQFGMH